MLQNNINILCHQDGRREHWEEDRKETESITRNNLMMTSKDASSMPAAQQADKQHHVAPESAHTNVLGMDGSDLEIGGTHATTTNKKNGLPVTSMQSDGSASATSPSLSNATRPIQRKSQRQWRPPSPTENDDANLGNGEESVAPSQASTVAVGNVSSRLAASEQPNESHGDNKTKPSSWWKRKLVGTSTQKTISGHDNQKNDVESQRRQQEDASATQYQSMETPINSDKSQHQQKLRNDSQQQKPSSQKTPQRKRQFHSSRQTYHPLSTASSADGALQGSPSNGNGNGISNIFSDDSANVEDQLRQDCAFFYRDMEDPSDMATGMPGAMGIGSGTPSPGRRSHGRRLRALLSGSSNSSLTTPYELTGTVGDFLPASMARRSHGDARYHATYQRLNQSLNFSSNENENNELYLYEDVTNNTNSTMFQSQSTNVTDGQFSSLLYEQNGRLLVRLPRDQIRLIMDSDMEPGMLSVEQWRQGDGKGNPVAQSSSARQSRGMMEPIDIEPQSPPGNNSASQPPPLYYVLTVPDDLYRRVVTEMSDGLTGPSFKQCCDESERADIRVALAILSVIMILMFIGSLEWPTE